MKCAARNFIKNALAKNYTVGVVDDYDGEVWNPGGYLAIIEEIRAVEMATLTIFDETGNRLGAAMVGFYDLDPEETLMDYTDNAAMRELAEEK